jgi:hypothetical protein
VDRGRRGRDGGRRVRGMCKEEEEEEEEEEDEEEEL